MFLKRNGMVNQKTSISLSLSLFAIALSACDTNSTTSPAQFYEPLSQESNSTTNASTDGNREKFITGSNVEDLENSWFCTITENGVFKSRDQIHLLASDSAKISTSLGSWNYANGALSYNVGGVSKLWKDVEFSSRFLDLDYFSASDQIQSEIFCNWSGPPRPQYIFQDPLNGTQDNAESDVEGAEIWLVTGQTSSVQNRFWSCLVDEFRAESYNFFDDGMAFTTSEKRWRSLSFDSVELISESGNADLISDIKFKNTDQGFNTAFSAVLNNSENLVCLLEGAPRATPWIQP